MVPDDETLRAILDGLRHGDVHITADRCTGDTQAIDAFCDLIRCAPALAAEVLRLRTAARAYRDATDVPDGDYDATRHAEALAALSSALGGDK